MKYKQDQACASCGCAFPVSASTCPRCGQLARREHFYAFASWWARLLATWIDIFLIYLCAVVLALVLSESKAGPVVGVAFWLGLFVYFVVMEATIGKTVGKMVFGAQVLDLGEKRIGWGRSIVRNLFKMLMLGGSLITLLCIICSKRSQRIGDMVAGTIVVKDVTKQVPELSQEAGPATVIATFGPTTGWVGKTISFQSEQFLLEGYGPISADDVLLYDEQEHLVWANDSMRAWVGAKTQAAGREDIGGVAAQGGRFASAETGATGLERSLTNTESILT